MSGEKEKWLESRHWQQKERYRGYYIKGSNP
jgi:hypothetical protein